MRNIMEKDHFNKVKRGSSFSIIIVFTCLSIIGYCLLPLLPLKLNLAKKSQSLTVSYSMGGQTARVIESEVTSKLEGIFSRVKGVANVRSYSSNSFGNITIEFSEYSNMEIARFEISNIIRQAWPSLPEGVSYPTVSSGRSSSSTDAVFLRYIINAPLSPIQIQDYVENNIKSRFKDIQGIDKVNVSGANQMTYKLEYDYILLSKYQVSTEDIRSAIQTYLAKEFIGVGKIDHSGKDEWIRVALINSDKSSRFDPSVIQIKNKEGRILYLDQLAKLNFIEEEPSSAFRINGLNSIYLSFSAKDGADQLLLSKKVKSEIDNITALLPSVYEIHLSHDAGEYIKKEMTKIYYRSGLTILILLCFVLLIYRNLKHSILIVISLVANMGIACIFYYLLKIQLHLYSMTGIMISLTLIIDNVIIMSDQIIQRKNLKAFLAILTATVTSIGTIGIIFYVDENLRMSLIDFAWIIIINLVVSLLVSLFLVPALIDKLGIRKRSEKRRLQNSFYNIRSVTKLNIFFNRIYERFIIFSYSKRKWAVLFIVLLFGLPVFLLPDKIGKDKNPFIEEKEDNNVWKNMYNKTLGSDLYRKDIKPISDIILGGTFRLFYEKVKRGGYYSAERNETSLYVAASLPNGSTYSQMNSIIQKMENYIGQYPAVRQFTTSIESGQQAGINILFTPEHQRSSFPHELKSKLINKALELGGGSWAVYGFGDGFNNDVKEQAGSSQIKLLGYNYDELMSQAKVLQDTLLKNRRIKKVTIDSKFSWYESDYREFGFSLNKGILAQYDLSPIKLYSSFAPMFERSRQVANWEENGKIYPVQLVSTRASSLDIWNSENIPSTINYKEIKLKETASIDKIQAPLDIAKVDQQYLLCLQYEYIGSYLQAEKVMNSVIDGFNNSTPLGYKAEKEVGRGMWGKDNSSQFWLIIIIIIIIYFTTSILFNSLKQPFIIIFIIPISFIGLFLTFYLFDLNFDQGGFAAFILLAAISVNANIYILNEFNNIKSSHLVANNLKAYKRAFRAKIKPIFLTVISTVLGFIPFIVGEYRESFWFPLAAGTIGGLCFSLLALIIFLPLFMEIGNNKRHSID